MLPDDATDFANNAAIASVSLKGRDDSFANSGIAAAPTGKVNLGEVTTANNGVPFGVAADAIASLCRVTSGDKFKIASFTTRPTLSHPPCRPGRRFRRLRRANLQPAGVARCARTIRPDAR